MYAGTLDSVVEIVHLRDLVGALNRGTSPWVSVCAVVQVPMEVPESASADHVLTRLRHERTHVAIVIDEHGGTAGLVTMEHLREEIVGEVHDEFARPHDLVQPQPDGTVQVDGRMAIDDFAERFGLEPSCE